MKRIRTFVLLGALVVGGATAALAAPQQAAASDTVWGCRVSAGLPWVTWIDGVKYAAANFYVSCGATGRSGTLNRWIMEDDVTSDDTVAHPVPTYFTVPAYTTYRFGPVYGQCRNFDPTGSEELYSKATISIGYLPASDRSANVSAVC